MGEGSEIANSARGQHAANSARVQHTANSARGQHKKINKQRASPEAVAEAVGDEDAEMADDLGFEDAPGLDRGDYEARVSRAPMGVPAVPDEQMPAVSKRSGGGSVKQPSKKAKKWEQSHGAGSDAKYKRKAEQPAEQLQSSSAARMDDSSSPAPLPSSDVLWLAVAGNTASSSSGDMAVDVEELGEPSSDALYSPASPIPDTSDDPMHDISSFHIDGVRAVMSRSKAELVELASLQVEHCFRKQNLEVTKADVTAIAALQVELGACDLVELFSPARFTKSAGRFGLKPGFAVDLLEAKPYGQNAGEHWDLLKDSDVKELEEMLAYEKPKFLTGSPPCDPFSALLNISKYRCDPAKREASFARGTRHLRTAMRFYNKQMDEGRFFLHEHPYGATSRDDTEMVKLQQRDGVFTVDGPMCFWEFVLGSTKHGYGHVHKRSRWVTNCRFLAKALDQWCSNQTGSRPWHRHLTLVGGLAKLAAAYPPKLVSAVLRAMRSQMLQNGDLSEIDLKLRWIGFAVSSSMIRRHDSTCLLAVSRHLVLGGWKSTRAMK